MKKVVSGTTNIGCLTILPAMLCFGNITRRDNLEALDKEMRDEAGEEVVYHS